MTSALCPNCGASVIPIMYGYPTSEALEESKEGASALGGCEIGIDDAQRYCMACGSTVWGHGVYASRGGDLRVMLGSTSQRFEASLPPNGPLWLSDEDGSVVTIARSDLELVVLVCLVELFGDGMTLAGWLRYRHLRFVGEVVGPIERFSFDAEPDGRLPKVFTEGQVIVSSGEQSLAILGIYERLILHLIRDVTRHHKLDDCSELLGWFADLGLELEAAATA